MQVDTIQMDSRIARIHYLDYKKKVSEARTKQRTDLQRRVAEATERGSRPTYIRNLKRHVSQLEREDEQMLVAYKAMALGARILNLGTVIHKAGVNQESQWLPRLAIARADWSYCYFGVDKDQVAFCQNNMVFAYDRRTNRQNGWKTAGNIGLSTRLFPAETWNEAWRKGKNFTQYPVQALVPSVPLALRPADDLSGYHILWEAQWQLTAPEDPILLKRISTDFYVVLGQWDLTPLEQSVLEGRFST
jgi:hypothetical protein